MTVEKLIKALSQFAPDTKVVIAVNMPFSGAVGRLSGYEYDKANHTVHLVHNCGLLQEPDELDNFILNSANS